MFLTQSFALAMRSHSQKCYDECADFWRRLLVDLKEALKHLKSLKARVILAQYWGTAQRFFLQVGVVQHWLDAKDCLMQGTGNPQ